MSNICDRCGKVFDVSNLANEGGSAIMIAFCYKNTTSMSNVSFCPECTDLHILPSIRMLQARAKMNIVTEDNDG